MDFLLLGPLEVRRDEVGLPLGGPRLRAVLAALMVRANDVVGVDYLAGAVWQRPPASLNSNVRTYVAALRRLLGHERLLSRPEGYQLIVRPDELDLAVFESLAGRANQAELRGEVEIAAKLYEQALAVWRGSPLAGLPIGGTLETEVARLEERRLGVLERHIGTQLQLGRHDEVAGALGTLVAEHPFRERLGEYQMLALYQSGRRAEALEAYQQIRQRVVTELGVEPGPRQRELHRQILAGAVPVRPTTSPARVVPAELPAAVAGFTGRRDQLDSLDRLLDRVDESVVIASVSGTAGVGKTALAVHWAHRVTDRFPDGQIFIDLGGYGCDQPVATLDALGQLLSRFGLPPHRFRSNLHAQGATYRSVLAGRRMLVILDNARTADQVRPLLPGRSGCLVLVTSRQTLSDLAALDGAFPIAVDPLAPDESFTMLGRILDDNRIRDERAALTDLARQCGHLPLALRLAATWLSTRPQHTVTALTRRLRQWHPPSIVRVPGDPVSALERAFDHSYLALDEQARRLFRRLALPPGPDATVHVAAALVDVTLSEVDPLLEVLTSAHLVAEHVSGRYRLPGLLHNYAAKKTAAEDTAAERDGALRRVRVRHQLQRRRSDTCAG